MLINPFHDGAVPTASRATTTATAHLSFVLPAWAMPTPILRTSSQAIFACRCAPWACRISIREPFCRIY